MQATRTVTVVDTTAPTLSISAPSSIITAEGPVTYTMTYSGADTVTLSDGGVTLNTTDTANADVAVTGSGTTSRTVTLNNITGNGTLGISIDEATASENSSNMVLAAGPSDTFQVDSTWEVGGGAPSA